MSCQNATEQRNRSNMGKVFLVTVFMYLSVNKVAFVVIGCESARSWRRRRSS